MSRYFMVHCVQIL